MAGKNQKTKAKKRVSHKKLSYNYKIFVHALNSFVALMIFINFAILFTGGWDDLRSVDILFLPIISIVAMVLSMINVQRHRSNGAELLCSIIALAASVLTVFIYFIYPAIIPLISA